MNKNLESKLDNILRVGSTLSFEGLEVRSTANFGAIDKDIEELNKQLRIPLDYIQFLRLHNGCEIFNYDNLDGFKFFGTTELAKQDIFWGKDYEKEWNQEIIFFCELIGEGNFLGFKVIDESEYFLLDCFHEDNPSDWTIIGKSFDLFIEKLIDSKGDKFWLRNERME